MPTTNNDLDIVIPVYGRADLLRQCLDNLYNQGYPFNLIIVDNNSPDDPELKELYKEVSARKGSRIVYNSKNYGFPKACNIGANYGKGSFLLFLNSDCMVFPYAIEDTLEELSKPDVGVVGLKLLFPPNIAGLDPRIRPINTIQHVGISINIRGMVYHPFLGWNSENNKPNAVEGKDVWAVTGAYMLTYKSIFKKAGGFDEAYGIGTYEDVDYCMKVHSMKKKVSVVTKNAAYHYVGASAEKYQIAYPINNNKSYFMNKWQGTPQLQWSDWVYL